MIFKHPSSVSSTPRGRAEAGTQDCSPSRHAKAGVDRPAPGSATEQATAAPASLSTASSAGDVCGQYDRFRRQQHHALGSHARSVALPRRSRSLAAALRPQGGCRSLRDPAVTLSSDQPVGAAGLGHGGLPRSGPGCPCESRGRAGAADRVRSRSRPSPDCQPQYAAQQTASASAPLASSIADAASAGRSDSSGQLRRPACPATSLLSAVLPATCRHYEPLTSISHRFASVMHRLLVYVHASAESPRFPPGGQAPCGHGSPAPQHAKSCQPGDGGGG